MATLSKSFLKFILTNNTSRYYFFCLPGKGTMRNGFPVGTKPGAFSVVIGLTIARVNFLVDFFDFCFLVAIAYNPC